MYDKLRMLVIHLLPHNESTKFTHIRCSYLPYLGSVWLHVFYYKLSQTV